MSGAGQRCSADTGSVGRAFEDVVGSIYGKDTNLGPRHNSFIRKLSFDLESSLVLYTNGTQGASRSSYVLNPCFILKKAQAMSWKGSQKERKKFLADCTHLSTITRPKLRAVVEKLRSVYGWEGFCGYRFHGLVFHFFRDYIRVKHALGLSDAIDQAMSNSGYTVSFPTVVSTPLTLYQRAFVSRSRIYNRHENFNCEPRVCHEPLGFRVAFCRKAKISSRRRYDLLHHYLKVLPKNLPEKEYVRLIKLSLAGTFSAQMNQDLPPRYEEEGIPLFPKFTQKRLDNLLVDKRKRVQFYFNLLQSKALCAPVGSDMIMDAYEKHKASLCRPSSDCIPKDKTLYAKLYKYGRNVGRNLNYDPFTTTLPNGRASIEKNRTEGGNIRSLKDCGTLQKFVGNPLLGLSSEPRVEPFVLGLFGPPGSGKTTLLSQLVNLFHQRLAPEMARADFVYSRSCSVAHWDGYHHQPLVVLDDFGQNLQDRTDLAEFMTLVSCNDYILPMAELSEKGRKFSSPIVIVTTNMGFRCDLIEDSSGGLVLEDPVALWRRFDLPILVERGKDLRVYDSEFTQRQYDLWKEKHSTCTGRIEGGNTRISGRAHSTKLEFIRSVRRADLLDEVFRGYVKKFDYHSRMFSEHWIQKVFCGNVYFDKFVNGPIWDPSVSEVDPLAAGSLTRSVVLDFPSYPPESAPIVKAHAIPEPLKVRMITIAESDTKVLQPLQKALWGYLGSLPQCCLTNGVKTLEDFSSETLPWIHRIEQVIQNINQKVTGSDSLWLSGDYTAATDNFPMWVTEALIEGILREIDHEPTKRWVRWEISSHTIRYPGDSEGRQTSGQLMGSLLSFPLLCFLNDFVMTESGFINSSYLVNGDDVVARGTLDQINTWKSLAPRVGLSLSLGKNFIDRDFCSVNSQLFFNGNVIHTGKVSCQERNGTTIGYCFSEAQFYWGSTPEIKENFLIRNWRRLRASPRSLHFSTAHGGLGLGDTNAGLPVDCGLAKRVFLYDVLHPFFSVFRVEGAPFSFVRTPIVRGSTIEKHVAAEHPSVKLFNQFQTLQTEGKENEARDDLSHSELRRFMGSCHQAGSIHRIIPEVETVITSGKFDLTKAPPRGWLDFQYVAITNGLAGRFRDEMIRGIFELYIQEWEKGNLSHTLEYIDFEDLPLSKSYHELIIQFDSYSDLLEGDEVDEASLSDEDLKILRSDVVSFWEPVEKLESNDGGRLFTPRPWPLYSRFSELIEAGIVKMNDINCCTFDPGIASDLVRRKDGPRSGNGENA